MLRFGPFELDADSAELLRHGERIPLPPQPFKVLALLVRKDGAVVTRAEIRDQVWGAGTHVEFDQGLNFAIRQIREALDDDAATPQFIETLPRRGYRFLMPITSSAPEKPATLTRLIVLPFRLLRDDPDTAFLAFSLPDAVTSSLSGLESLVVRSSLVASRYAGAPADTRAIGAEAVVDMIVTGTLLRSADAVRVNAQLTEAVSGTLLWSHTAQASVGDFFQLQDELTRRIVESLAVPLTVRDRQRLATDVPSSKAAYDHFLRGNQLSVDPKQWSVARELYERCVAEDPRFAPAWARLGRVYHVQTKYIESAGGDTDECLTRAAGLVTACRYCGLLDASVAAHQRARTLDRKIHQCDAHLVHAGRLAARGHAPGRRVSVHRRAGARGVRTRRRSVAGVARGRGEDANALAARRRGGAGAHRGADV